VTHVENRIDPLSDADIVETELMLSDLESLEKRVNALEKKAKQGDKESKALHAVVEKVLPLLRDGKPARMTELTEDEKPLFKALQLLTSKPIVYVCNVEEGSAASGNSFSAKVAERAKAEGAASVIISAKIESEFAGLATEDRDAFLADLGLKEAGLNQLIRAGYSLLDLITYFTVGPKEARAWTITQGTKAPQAAAVIHTDFEKGFIRAETIGYDDYVGLKGEAGARDAGKMRLEGKDYIVKDGDVLHFRFAN
jgi:GTP-binding protein YchF